MTNLAQVHIELRNYCHALLHAHNGLELEPTHVKCLYRCGVANKHLGNHENALLALQKAQQLVRLCKSTCCPHLLRACIQLMHTGQRIATTSVTLEL